MPTGWVFRVEVISNKTVYTEEIIEELDELFSEESLIIDKHLIEELHEDVKLFKKKEKEA